MASTIEFYGGYEVYSETGVDLTLLRENLKYTPEERVTRHSGSLRSVVALDEPLRARDKKRVCFAMFDASAILHRLVDQHVEFVLIGGLAMVAHGSAYITKDLDICYSRTATNLAALVTALRPINPYLRGAPPGLPFRFDVPTIQAGLNFTLTTDLGDIDLLGEVGGVGWYEQALAQSVEKQMYGLAVHVLSIDGLIASKKAADRIKDRLHVLELEELKKMEDAEQGGTDHG